MASPTKEKSDVQIPLEFVEFLREVQEMIRRGFGQVTEESDDGIQIPEYNTCGGLWNKEKGIFGFVHYLDPPQSDRRWEFQLNADTISGIAEGKVTTLSGWQCSHEDCDNFYTEEDGYCRLCDHPDGREAAIASEKEFNRSVEEFTARHGEEFDAAMKERVQSVHSLAEDPELLKDPRAFLKAAMKANEEFDEKVRKMLDPDTD